MAEAAAKLAGPPLHLQHLYRRAKAIARETNADFDRVYLALRHQAYQQEMQSLYDMAARALAVMPPQPIIITPDGVWMSAPRALPESTRGLLTEVAQAACRHYELEPTNG